MCTPYVYTLLSICMSPTHAHRHAHTYASLCVCARERKVSVSQSTTHTHGSICMLVCVFLNVNIARIFTRNATKVVSQKPPRTDLEWWPVVTSWCCGRQPGATMFSGNPEADVSQTRGLVMDTGGGGEDSNQDALARSRCLVMNSGSK